LDEVGDGEEENLGVDHPVASPEGNSPCSRCVAYPEGFNTGESGEDVDVGFDGNDCC
jgi:hypothetical protein